MCSVNDVEMILYVRPRVPHEVRQHLPPHERAQGLRVKANEAVVFRDINYIRKFQDIPAQLSDFPG